MKTKTTKTTARTSKTEAAAPAHQTLAHRKQYVPGTAMRDVPPPPGVASRRVWSVQPPAK
jgi:hypothetical protein